MRELCLLTWLNGETSFGFYSDKRFYDEEGFEIDVRMLTKYTIIY